MSKYRLNMNAIDTCAANINKSLQVKVIIR